MNLSDRWKSIAARCAVLTTAVAGGALCHAMNWPLPWILGPLLVVAAASIAGLPVYAPQQGRRVGQMIVGASIGLGLTVEVAGKVLAWLPVMIATSLFAVAVSTILSVPFSRLAGIDNKTGFFAMMPGGLAEMANIGVSVGASPEAIALSQTIRLTMVVCLLPPLCMLFGFHGDFVNNSASGLLSPSQMALVFLCAAAGIAFTSLIRLNNPWMIGSILAVGLLAASGASSGHLPNPLYAAGQFMIGISIGARFRREAVIGMLRVCWSTVLFVILLSATLFCAAFALAAVTSLDEGTAALATSAGGIAEMTLTAQNLSLDVALVAAFHFIRTLVVNGFAAHLWTMMQWIAPRNDTTKQ